MKSSLDVLSLILFYICHYLKNIELTKDIHILHPGASCWVSILDILKKIDNVDRNLGAELI